MEISVINVNSNPILVMDNLLSKIEHDYCLESIRNVYDAYNCKTFTTSIEKAQWDYTTFTSEELKCYIENLMSSSYPDFQVGQEFKVNLIDPFQYIPLHTDSYKIEDNTHSLVIYMTDHARSELNSGSTYFCDKNNFKHFIHPRIGKAIIFSGRSLPHGTIPAQEKRITLSVSCKL